MPRVLTELVPKAVLCVILKIPIEMDMMMCAERIMVRAIRRLVILMMKMKMALMIFVDRRD